MLGIPEGVSTTDGLNQLYFDCIKEILGPEGSMLVPTYSYTFGKSFATNIALFDPKMTPAETGPFPEYFRKQAGTKRSSDPMVSVCGIGPICKDLM